MVNVFASDAVLICFQRRRGEGGQRIFAFVVRTVILKRRSAMVFALRSLYEVYGFLQTLHVCKNPYTSYIFLMRQVKLLFARLIFRSVCQALIMNDSWMIIQVLWGKKCAKIQHSFPSGFWYCLKLINNSRLNHSRKHSLDVLHVTWPACGTQWPWEGAYPTTDFICRQWCVFYLNEISWHLCSWN